MLPTILTTLLLTPLRLCQASPTFQEEYRGDYVPKVIETEYGLQIVAPDTPYVAAAGQDKLYFINTRFDTETARHIKEQIERATVPKPEEYISIDGVLATAEVKDSVTGETIFVFDPAYARVLFARGMNRHNPELKLPEHEPAGTWEVAYDLSTLLMKGQLLRSDHGCSSDGQCVQQSDDTCKQCHRSRVGNECEVGPPNTVGKFNIMCTKAVDTPRKDGETDSNYYQRMDKLHWG